LNKPNNFHFLSPVFLLEELDNHADKILSITGYTEAEYKQIKSFVTKNIRFIDSAAINKKDWELLSVIERH
jgi:predicted nucleic acid-binding protein